MKALIAAPLLVLLSACATAKVPEPRVVIQEVQVPVAVSCVPQSYDRTRPDYVDSNDALKSAVDPAERYQLLFAGRAQRQAREQENEAVISGCATEGTK